MSHEGFCQCTYCDLWVPTALQLVHLATHPGYMQALLGQASSSGVQGVTGPVIGASPIPSTGPDRFAIAGAAVVQQPPNPDAPRAETALLASAAPARTVFGALTGMHLVETLKWMKDRCEKGLLDDCLNANVVRPLLCGKRFSVC